MTIKLRDYQLQAIEKFEEARHGDDNRLLMTAATGSGKTIITSFIMRDEVRQRSGRCLFLVHRDELIKQTVDKLRKVDASLRVGVIQGKTDEWGDDYDVSVASVATMGRSNRIGRYPADLFSLIIIDETHRATAASYRTVLDHFRAFSDENPPVVLGVTATADRTDGVSLDEIYTRHIFHVGIEELMRLGALVPIRALSIAAGIDLSGVSRRGGDFNEAELASVLNTENCNALIAEAMKKFASDRKSIVFAVNVQHAEDLAKALRLHGIEARAVHSKTKDKTRERYIGMFRRGTLQVLVNVGLFVEGFDEPSVDCVVWATKTMSAIKFVQGIGRGSRLSPETGKRDLLVLDLAENAGKHSKTLQSVPRMFGLSHHGAAALADGMDVLTAKKVDEQKTKEDEERKEAEKREKEERKRGRGLRYQEIDLFAKDELPPLLVGSRFEWGNVGTVRYFSHTMDKQAHVFQAGGAWTTHVLRNGNGARFEYEKTLCAGVPFEQAVTHAEEFLTTNQSTRNVTKSYETMRKQPPTFGQMKMLGKKFTGKTKFDAFIAIGLRNARQHFAYSLMRAA